MPGIDEILVLFIIAAGAKIGGEVLGHMASTTPALGEGHSTTLQAGPVWAA